MTGRRLRHPSPVHLPGVSPLLLVPVLVVFVGHPGGPHSHVGRLPRPAACGGGCLGAARGRRYCRRLERYRGPARDLVPGVPLSSLALMTICFLTVW